ITRERQAREQLSEARERFALAVEGSRDGLWDWDLRTNAIYYSPRWKVMLGYDDDAIANHYSEWESRLHPDDRERALETIRAYIEGRTEVYELEPRLLHRDGTYRWILARGAAVRDSEGRPCRMAGSHTDITQRKREEEELRQARDAAMAASRAKSEFLANVSH